MAVQPHRADANAIAAIALIIGGETSRAIDLLSEALEYYQDESRAPVLNILGVAHYVNGDFSTAVERIELDLTRNGPTGSQMDVFLAAAYAPMDKDFEAQAIMSKPRQLGLPG